MGLEKHSFLTISNQGAGPRRETLFRLSVFAATLAVLMTPTATLADRLGTFGYLYYRHIPGGDRCYSPGIDLTTPLADTRVHLIGDLTGLFCDESEYELSGFELTGRLGYDLIDDGFAFGPFIGGVGFYGSGRTRDRLNNYNYDIRETGPTLGVFLTHETDDLVLRLIYENRDIERTVTNQFGGSERDFDFIAASLTAGWKLDRLYPGLTAVFGYAALPSVEQLRLGVGFRPGAR